MPHFAGWVGRRLVLGAVAALAGATACSESAQRARPDIILIVVDTWRFDALGANGSDSRELTPELDALITRGVRFERAIASSPWTLPAVASLLTGQYPTVHGAYGRYREVSKIRATVPTLPEKLEEGGYLTHAVVNAPFLDPRFGFQRGFAIYDYFPSSNLDTRRAAPSVDRALSISRELPTEQPAFLMLHLFDPHLAYDPPAPWDERWTAGYTGSLAPPFSALEEMRAGTLNPTDEDAAYIRALYDGEVSYVDAQLGRFVRELDQLERDRDRWIVITADHGEEFRDHGGWEHGHTMYAEQLRVPLLVLPPDSFPRPVATVRQQVRVLDLFPTLLELARCESAQRLAGESLLPYLRAESDRQRVAYSEREHLGRPSHSLRDGDYTLIAYPDGGPSELYEFASDPTEQHDLARERPDRVRRMEARLESMVDSLAAQAHSAGSEPEAMELDPKLLQRLRSLGYTGG